MFYEMPAQIVITAQTFQLQDTKSLEEKRDNNLHDLNIGDLTGFNSEL